MPKTTNRDQHTELRGLLDLEDLTSEFAGLSPDLQFLWRVLFAYGHETVRMGAEITDMKKSIDEILKALRGKDA